MTPCPFCHNSLNFETMGSGNSAYYRVRCCQEQCFHRPFNERLFIGFADDYPDRRVTDYSLFLQIEDLHYTFTSIEKETPYSSIEYQKSPFEEPTMLYQWEEWIPLQDNLDIYIEKIQRLSKLKVFW